MFRDHETLQYKAADVIADLERGGGIVQGTRVLNTWRRGAGQDLPGSTTSHEQHVGGGWVKPSQHWQIPGGERFRNKLVVAIGRSVNRTGRVAGAPARAVTHGKDRNPGSLRRQLRAERQAVGRAGSRVDA